MEPQQEKNLEPGRGATTIELLEKQDAVHLEHQAGLTTIGEWAQIREDAIIAEKNEHSLTIFQALRAYPRSVFWSFAISLCIIMEGYDTALLGSLFAETAFRTKYGQYHANLKAYQLQPQWQSAVQQIGTVGNILGIFLASEFQRRFGYIRTIQLSLIWLTAGIFIVFFSPNIQVLFVGEFFCGFPFGAFSSSVVAYASEVTPVALRGYLTTYVNLCWVIGQFLASGVLLKVQGRTDKWAYKLPFAIQWIWPLPLFLIATIAPESPWWLVRAGKLDKAEKNVRRLRRAGVSPDAVDAKQQVAMMVRTNQHEIDNAPGTNIWDCFRGSDLRRTEIACFGWAIQVLAGSSFGNQGPFFFEQAGLSSVDAFKVTLGQRALAFSGTCFSWVTMTYVGRRRVYLTGVAVLAMLLLITGILAVPSSHGNKGAKWGQTVMILLWVFTFDNSIAPLGYCIVGEASSTRLRVQTVGIARNFYNVCSISAGFINTYALNPTAWNWKGYEGFFWFGSAVLCWTWAYFRLPEMKGRTYRELDILFERGISARKFKETVVNEEDEH